MAQACLILLSLLCVIVADYTGASGSGDPTYLVPSGTPGGGSTNARSNPIPLLLLLVVLVIAVLLVMVCGCCIAICCVLGCYRCWSKRSVDPSVEPGIEFENPAFQYTEPHSNKEGVSHNLDSPRTMRAPEFTQSSQSFVTMATPRLAVNRPISTSAVTISNKALTISNKGALQFEVHLRGLATPFTETQSLPRMPHNQEQCHFQPSWPAEGLSQTSLPPHLESTAPTSTTNEPQETEV